MGSVYGRLGYNFDTVKFNGADVITTGANNYLNNTTINLNQWQIDDMANQTVGGYYQNPHTSVLNNLIIVLTGMIETCNSNTTTFTDAQNTANDLCNVAISTISTISGFTTHTNRMSGVEQSPDISLYPDLKSAMAVGRQILNITNKTDSVQNNTPILGNFTSLYIGPDLQSSYNTINNDNIIINNSISSNTSNISSNTMNTIIMDISSLQTLMGSRQSADTSFYVNSLGVIGDYQTVLQFSNTGATQNSLIKLIGTDKLKNNLKIT